MNAPHEEAVEFSKISKRENRVYVGNLSYDVKYRDLMEFMRGGGWGASNCCCGFGSGSGIGYGEALAGGEFGCADDEVQSLVVLRGDFWPKSTADLRVCGGLKR